MVEAPSSEGPGAEAPEPTGAIPKDHGAGGAGAGGTSTRDRLLQVALRLFWEKGYGSTSVADILREAGANSGSLYHFFETKQALLVGVLEQYRDGIHPMLLAPVWEGVDDPLERVFALLAGYRALLLESDFRLGCPIGNLALELSEPDPPVRTALAENFDAWTGAVEGCLRQVPGLAERADPRALARFALATMEGGVMLARTYRDPGPFDDAVAGLRAHLESLIDTTPGVAGKGDG